MKGWTSWVWRTGSFFCTVCMSMHCKTENEPGIWPRVRRIQLPKCGRVFLACSKFGVSYFFCHRYRITQHTGNTQSWCSNWVCIIEGIWGGNISTFIKLERPYSTYIHTSRSSRYVVEEPTPIQFNFWCSSLQYGWGLNDKRKRALHTYIHTVLYGIVNVCKGRETQTVNDKNATDWHDKRMMKAVSLPLPSLVNGCYTPSSPP